MVSINKVTNILEDLKIFPKVHPQHYLIHKYWGRKPHNLISEYLAALTKKNDVVLDPFMGSGGVVIESNKLERQSIGHRATVEIELHRTEMLYDDDEWEQF